MSTVVAVKKNGFVAIAADTLSSMGGLKLSAAYQKNAGKILRVGDSYIGLTGYAVHQQVLEHVFRSAGEAPRFSSVAEIFSALLMLHARLRQDYFLNPRGDQQDPYESTQMNLLIANRFGIFGVGSLRTVTEYERFWAAGSGMEYALGASHALYDRPSDARTIAEAAVSAAADFDSGTDAPVESYVMRAASSLTLVEEPASLLEV